MKFLLLFLNKDSKQLYTKKEIKIRTKKGEISISTLPSHLIYRYRNYI